MSRFHMYMASHLNTDKERRILRMCLVSRVNADIEGHIVEWIRLFDEAETRLYWGGIIIRHMYASDRPYQTKVLNELKKLCVKYDDLVRSGEVYYYKSFAAFCFHRL